MGALFFNAVEHTQRRNDSRCNVTAKQKKKTIIACKMRIYPIQISKMCQCDTQKSNIKTCSAFESAVTVQMKNFHLFFGYIYRILATSL